MSREIKFRALTGMGMIEPYSVRNGKAFIIKHCNQNDPVIKGSDGANYYRSWDVDVATDYPLMQFTGLHDVNGVEIYEGDIVKACSDGLTGVFDVRWRQEGAPPCYILFPAYQSGKSWNLYGSYEKSGKCVDPCEVIGNIYENPELLK